MASKKTKTKKTNHRDYIEVPHFVKVIKDNEKKYTVILVIFFMIIMAIFGYKLLTIDTNEYENIKIASSNDDYVSLNSSNITLTNKNIISNDLGISNDNYIIHISNNTDKIKKYKIYFVSDYDNECSCGKKLFNKNDIRYSINNKDILTLEDDLLFTEGILKKKESKDITFNMWISDNINKDEDLHYHGHFIIK